MSAYIEREISELIEIRQTLIQKGQEYNCNFLHSLSARCFDAASEVQKAILIVETAKRLSGVK